MKDFGSPEELHPTGHILHHLPMGALLVRDGYFYPRPCGESTGSLSVLGMLGI